MNIYNLIIDDKEKVNLNEVYLPEEMRFQLLQLIREHYYVEELKKHGLPVNNKILLHGSSGCGKTMTAKAIASALGKPVFVLDLSSIVSAKIGETAQFLQSVFDKAEKEGAVLFLDEFDQIGKARNADDNDVGEMRRLVNSLLQMIDYYPQESLLICATNHIEVIDTALLRRFQLKISFEKPSKDMLDSYYDELLSAFPDDIKNIDRRYAISYAEARDYAYTSVKKILIEKLERQSVKEVYNSEN